MTSYDDDLRLAHVLADTADSVTMSRFRAQDLVVETKPDLTPVSDADRKVEEAIRATLARARPRDAVHGEELPDTGHGPRRWVIDPIDRRWWAAAGSGAYNGKSLASATRMQVSKVDSLTDASLSYSSLTGWEDEGRGEHFLQLARQVWRTRAYGDFWSYMLVAEGAVDIAAEPEVALHDLAAPSVVVAEAGGRFTSLDGTSGPAGGSAVATNGLLHDEVMARLTA